MMPRHLLPLALLLAGGLTLPSAATAQRVVVSDGDGQCPSGMRPLSVEQARENSEAVCRQLGRWHIARLARGGSMDGPGYRCQIRESDSRSLGHTLCAPAPVVVAPPRPPRRGAFLPGVFEVEMERGRSVVYTFAADGTVRRARGRRGIQDGRWTLEGRFLVLDWGGRRPAERFRLRSRGAVLEGEGGTRLVRRGAPTPPPAQPATVVTPGTYAGVHPHWRDTVIIFPNGTYRRGSGDAGRWHVEGDTLVLDWNNWGAERLRRTGPQTYRASSNGFTLTFQSARLPRR